MSKESRRGRWKQIVLLVVILSLLFCTCSSLAGNAGLLGWSLWNRWELTRARERIGVLEPEVRRLHQVLLDNDIEIPLAPADRQLMDTIERQVAVLRGLEPLQPVERALMTPDQLRERIRQDFEENFSFQDARDYTLTLAAFDFVDPELDLYDLWLRLYTEQIAGFYDTETKQIYVIADLGLMGQLERLTYAHEYTHALQDQHFDLEALWLRDDAEEVYDSEYLAAVQALVEGDAQLLERQFMNTHYSPEEIVMLMREAMAINTTVLDQAPEIVRDALLFPYQFGLTFVQSLYEQGGWAAVDAAYADPPRSTEHILHPDRYRAGDEPQIVSLPPLTDTLGTGWRHVDGDIMGEFLIGRYLAQYIPEEDAETAAEGWGGDRYTVHYHEEDETLVLGWRIVWDTPADVEEFVDAYVSYAEARFAHSSGEHDGAQICWQGARDAACLAWGVIESTITLAPSQPVARLVLDALVAGTRGMEGAD
ncbi:MAG TPA: hypothetical protein ENN19_11525 [Chloroflexi bacterium]|nr:hypothetical protein [Chloroflexota bacterium]